MPEKRINVWITAYKDRPALMLQWYCPTTHRRKSRSAGTGDPKLAEKARADLEYELNHGSYAESSKMTWPAFRKIFETEYVSTRRRSTQRNYTVAFEHFERLCRPRLLRSINERTVSQFATALRREPGRAKGSTEQAPATISLRLCLLRSALRWAFRQKLLPQVPSFPVVKIPKKRPLPVPPESFERLYAKAPDDMMRAYLLAGWLGGLRLNEAAMMEWEPTTKAPYLDLARNRILFPAEFVKAAEDQWVPLDPALREAIERLPRRGKKVFCFLAQDGRRIKVGGIGARIIQLARQAGVKLTMHSLRRGFGCRYAGKVSAQVLQRLMRHSDIKITMGYYANIDEAVMDAVLGANGNSYGNKAAGKARNQDGNPDTKVN